MRRQKIKHLGFSRNYALEILLGLKRATIRKTNKGLKANDVVMLHARGSDGGVIGIGRIQEVEQKIVSELRDEDAQKEGFSSVEELLNALKTHFKKLEKKDEISIIRFRLEKINAEFAVQMLSEFAEYVLSLSDICIDPVDRSRVEEFLRMPYEQKLKLCTDKNLLKAFRRIYIAMNVQRRLREKCKFDDEAT
ncbi:MAG: ASCH domain-containing protein [Candidatus Baldrarchaeia archaeon]